MKRQLALIFLGVVIGVIALGGKFIFNFENKAETNSRTIQESVRELSELITLSYNYTDVITHSEQTIITWVGPDFHLPFGGKSFIFTYDGEMKTGINMAEVSINLVNSSIMIDLPSAQIFSHIVKRNSVKLYNEKSGLFNPISITDFPSLMAEREIEMEKKAVASGLLKQAQKNAQNQLNTFLLALPNISEEYEIHFNEL